MLSKDMEPNTLTSGFNCIADESKVHIQPLTWTSPQVFFANLDSLANPVTEGPSQTPQHHCKHTYWCVQVVDSKANGFHELRLLSLICLSPDFCISIS